MVSRQYIFEAKKNRLRSLLKYLCVLIGLLFFTYCITCIWIYKFNQKETQSTKNAFFRNPPDLITVFTGDIGRIEKALDLSKEYNGAKVFITGVYSKNTVYTIVKNYYKSKNEPPPLLDQVGERDLHTSKAIEGIPLLEKNVIEIDYSAKNTFENVISMLKFLRTHDGLKRVLVLSNDYHLLRIGQIIEKLKSSKSKTHFFYYGIKSDFTKWRSFKLHFKEILKNIRTWGFLLLWNEDASEETIAFEGCQGKTLREDGSCG